MRWHLLFALLLSGCAAYQSGAMRAPASPAEGQAQIASLEQQIERDRAALGLPHRPPPPPLAEASDHRNDLPAARPTVTPAAAPPPAPSPMEPMAKAASASGSDRDEPTCSGRGPCRYTRAICEAAERICSVAGFLGDTDARQRCGRARQDCQDARQATRDRCPGC
jgi:hypothetical protein